MHKSKIVSITRFINLYSVKYDSNVSDAICLFVRRLFKVVRSSLFYYQLLHSIFPIGSVRGGRDRNRYNSMSSIRALRSYFINLSNFRARIVSLHIAYVSLSFGDLARISLNVIILLDS